MKQLSLLIGLLSTAFAVQATEVEVTMKNKAFSVHELTVKPGDKVRFVNGDPFAHNIFSLTDPGSFDLGTYPQGDSREVVFKDAGPHDVECAIHPEMKLQVKVAK